MPVEGRGDPNAQFMLARKIFHQFREIAAKMNAESQKIRDNHDFRSAASRKPCDGFAQCWLRFQKCGFVQAPATRGSGVARHVSHGFVGGVHR